MSFYEHILTQTFDVYTTQSVMPGKTNQRNLVRQASDAWQDKSAKPVKTYL
jgi:hypothetical protein